MLMDMIIFGAGKLAESLYEIASFMGYQIVVFADNDEGKWGKRIKGIEIVSPEQLRNYSCKIVAPDQFFDAISLQLKKMDYSGTVVRRSELYAEILTHEYNREQFRKPDINRHLTYVIDSYFRQSYWGGAESWSCFVNNALVKKNCKTFFMCGNNDRFDNVVHDCVHYREDNQFEVMKKMIDDIIGNLPCVIFSIASIAIQAALIVKKLYPEQIKIVMVIHSDTERIYKNVSNMIEGIDKVICISKKIEETCIRSYGIPADKLLYHVNPILFAEKQPRQENMQGKLQVGFAARLTQLAKRTHLLPQVMDECFRRGLDVEFYIAGEGECLELLRTYVEDNHLEEKVHLEGWIPPMGMVDFWRHQDIYLNISDFEGMSLTMLEAMAYGAFPVVTDVSGVTDVIKEGKNGLIVPVEKWLGCVDKIAALDADRELLMQGSRYNMDCIREKCDAGLYVDWLISTFQMEG